MVGFAGEIMFFQSDVMPRAFRADTRVAFDQRHLAFDDIDKRVSAHFLTGAQVRATHGGRNPFKIHLLVGVAMPDENRLNIVFFQQINCQAPACPIDRPMGSA